jgi:hypothetical protein
MIRKKIAALRRKDAVEKLAEIPRNPLVRAILTATPSIRSQRSSFGRISRKAMNSSTSMVPE